MGRDEIRPSDAVEGSDMTPEDYADALRSYARAFELDDPLSIGNVEWLERLGRDLRYALEQEPEPEPGDYTFDAYLKDVMDAKLYNPSWRQGQAYFNVLASYRPDLADGIRGSNLDPFHRDERITVFLADVVRRWDA